MAAESTGETANSCSRRPHGSLVPISCLSTWPSSSSLLCTFFFAATAGETEERTTCQTLCCYNKEQSLLPVKKKCVSGKEITQVELCETNCSQDEHKQGE